MANRVDDWVLGSNIDLGNLLDPSLRNRTRYLRKLGLTKTIRQRLLALSRERLAPSACVISKTGRIYFGVPQKQSHPNCYGSAIEVAAGIACTSGSHDFVGAAVYYPYADSNHPGFSEIDLGRLAEHFYEPWNDMLLMQIFEEREDVFTHKDRLPRPWGGRTRRRKETQVRAATEMLTRKFDPQILLKSQTMTHTLEYLNRQLGLLICNSSADGITRPGRKRHAGCVFTAAGRVYYGVNLRSDTEGCDRCSEWNALGAAFLGGDDQHIVGACVYSPDYGEGNLACCGKCLNSLGGCIDPNVGDMIVAYFEPSKRMRILRYSQMPNISYAAAEGLINGAHN